MALVAQCPGCLDYRVRLEGRVTANPAPNPLDVYGAWIAETPDNWPAEARDWRTANLWTLSP